MGLSDVNIHMINLNKNFTKTLRVGNAPLVSICTGQNNIIYCCQPEKGSKLYGLELDGSMIFTYRSRDFDGPHGLATDTGGNLFVSCCRSNNIHCFEFDGTPIVVIIPADCELEWPYAISFSPNYEKLYVACGSYEKKKLCVCNVVFPEKKMSSVNYTTSQS